MLSERAALHVVITPATEPHQQLIKSSMPRSAGVDPMYSVLASADLAVVLAISLGAVLVAIAVIVVLVFLASRRRRRRRSSHQHSKHSCSKSKHSLSSDMVVRSHTAPRSPGSAVFSQQGFTMNDDDSPAILQANGTQHYLLDLHRATSSASGRQLNVAFAPDVNIQLEVVIIKLYLL